ncbi:restless-like transposase [Purpureocillium lavendulum]|uniref:Restless-like transposase n=1 Tax=Purpureocillium lavendulum TaxID=1247861 RepID=A0AB34FB78_9HYPO|nr:restless-like transposase [Purpureocillium lavendulum]
MASQSSEDEISAVERWIDSRTDSPIFTSHTQYNLEDGTIAAADLYLEGWYSNIAKAAAALQVPYYRVYGRTKGRHPVSRNGGNRTILSPSEDKAILIWAHRQVQCGHHILIRRLRHHVNAVLEASGRRDEVTERWCSRYMRKHRNLFHRRKAATQDAKRKAVEDRVTISSWFDGWSKYHSQSNIRKENIWNFDETGFMVGYLQRGGFVWTFTDVDRPILCDSHDRVSVTTIETISAAGETIPPFIILPGVNIPGKWLANDLEGGAMLATSEKGYISDRIALEWLQHFEKKTRPLDAEEKRLLLMDNCEAHYTSEFVSFCIDHNIDLFPLPPHLTHLLQPLDVGVFGPYKHWHQHILHREVADGAYDFGKSDFLYHLQEMRNRTFKKTTILSAWEKTGLYPYNPLRVLDSLQDSLSSLTPKVNESSLPGFVETHKDTGPARSPHAFAERPATPPNQSANLSPTTPPTIRRFDWLSVCTPSLSVPQIQRYHEYVGLRMHVSIYSNVALTPSVAHVYDKACKASKALELNGVAATAELRRLQKKSLERQRRDEHTMVVAKFGPISMHDARLRAARDEYNRQAAQEDEQRRIFRRDVRQEVGCFRRWLRETRARVRKSVSRLRTRDLFLEMSQASLYGKTRKDSDISPLFLLLRTVR